MFLIAFICGNDHQNFATQLSNVCLKLTKNVYSVVWKWRLYHLISENIKRNQTKVLYSFNNFHILFTFKHWRCEHWTYSEYSYRFRPNIFFFNTFFRLLFSSIAFAIENTKRNSLTQHILMKCMKIGNHNKSLLFFLNSHCVRHECYQVNDVHHEYFEFISDRQYNNNLHKYLHFHLKTTCFSDSTYDNEI